MVFFAAIGAIVYVATFVWMGLIVGRMWLEHKKFKDTFEVRELFLEKVAKRMDEIERRLRELPAEKPAESR